MKSTKQLIIRLLVCDMKHEQLLAGLQQLGFESDLHGTPLSNVVAELMGVSTLPAKEAWLQRYMDFLAQAAGQKLSGDGKSLLPLAEQCYAALQHVN